MIRLGKVDMKEIIISIIVEGRFSPCLNEFIDLCYKYALSAVSRSHLKESLLIKSGLSTSDIAYDVIADLFKEENGKFTFFNCYLENASKNLKDVPEEVIISKLAAIIISRTKQRLSEMMEDFGEIFIKVRKAARIFIQRNSIDFKKFIYDEKTFIYTCKEKEINFALPEYPTEKLVQNLFTFDYHNYNIPEVVNFLFKILGGQNYYLKAIDEHTLFGVVCSFYKQRMKNYVGELENVSYIDYEEGI